MNIEDRITEILRAPDPNPNNWQKHPSWDNPEDTNP